MNLITEQDYKKAIKLIELSEQRNLTPEQVGELLSASFVLASSIKISHELINGKPDEPNT